VSAGGEDAFDDRFAWIHDVPTAVAVLRGALVVAANARAAGLFGVSVADLCARGLGAGVAPAQHDVLASGIDAAALEASDPDADRQLILQSNSDPVRYLVLDFGPSRDGHVVVAISDATEFFHVMMLLAYSANTTMVIDETAGILWGPVGRYAAQEMDSPWYGRGEANPLGWLHPEDIGRVLESFTHVLAHPGVPYELTVRTRHVVIEDEWGMATIRAINLLDDPLVGGVLIQTQAEGVENVVSLGRTTGRFQSIAEAAPIGIIMSDHLGRPLYWNDAARDLFRLGPVDRSDGASDDDVDWTASAAADQREDLRSLLDRATSGQRGTLTARFALPNDDERWLAVTAAPQVNDVGEPIGWLATLQDLTKEVKVQHELEGAQERLLHLASHDPLTGLANRRLLADQLHRSLARMRRDKQGVALLFCDLDGFKPVNDSRGHDAGDIVLVQIAERMTHALRTNDLATRLGGDEFVMLIEGFSAVGELEAVARRLLEAAHEPIDLGMGDQIVIGVSIGIAVAVDGDTSDSLLSRADDLMYQAKAAGRGRYVLEPLPDAD
jgi:diguanylate cyclase (GGDEF)-like protein/PAS domain S-box-containing protein